jgi:hypothetical protein
MWHLAGGRRRQRGIKAVIPVKLKQFRAVATRYDNHDFMY